jgi:hypothetical protein
MKGWCKMFLVSQQARRLQATSLSFCLVLASTGPSVAMACEGGGAEPQNISITRVAWSGGGTCPETGGKVHFTALNQWCEFSIKNANNVEKVTISNEGLSVKTECEFPGDVLCLEFKKPAKVPQCAPNAMLAPKGGECYDRLEYFKKPTVKSELVYFANTISENGAPAKPTMSLLVE